MTRKDFVFIAQTLAVLRPDDLEGSIVWDAWHEACEEFARRLALTNPAFDSNKFFQATRS